MRLFELFDKPLDYKLMQTRTNADKGEKDHTFNFRVGDFMYKVYINVYPMASFDDDKDVQGNEIELPWEFYNSSSQNKHIMAIDFGQFDYAEKTVPIRGKIEIGIGDERTGREGTGNELQVFATVAEIAKDFYNEHKNYIVAIEYGAKENDPKRKRMYDTMMRKFGISGKRVEFADLADVGRQVRVLIVL